MNPFVENPLHFAADCVQQHGRCMVAPDNFLFLDRGEDISAVDYLQAKCGHVVIIPDQARDGRALLYHTSCQRMTDVVHRLFADCLEAPVRLPHSAAEMTVGELHRRCVTIPCDACRTRIEEFDFEGAP